MTSSSCSIDIRVRRHEDDKPRESRTLDSLSQNALAGFSTPATCITICFSEEQLHRQKPNRASISLSLPLISSALPIDPPHNGPPPHLPTIPPSRSPSPNSPLSDTHNPSLNIHPPPARSLHSVHTAHQHHLPNARRRWGAQQRPAQKRPPNNAHQIPSPAPEDAAAITLFAHEGAAALDDS